MESINKKNFSHIRSCFLLTLFLFTASLVLSQNPKKWTPKDRNLSIRMQFPDGKTKALILSFDDGPKEDRKIVSLLNQYNLKGTFHLNSGRLSDENMITEEEVKTLYTGHEISLHGYNHQGMTNLSNIDYIYEIGEDRRLLEQVSGRLVRGLAYPFGSYNVDAIPTMKDLGVEYARTVEDTEAFDIPKNFMLWHPSIHMFAKANYMGNSPEKDQIEFDKFDNLTDAFLNENQLALYYVWGHSWEYNQKWDKVEAFFKKISNIDEIYYTTHIELVDYLNAFKSMVISVDKTQFLNNSAVDLFFSITDYSNTKKPWVHNIELPAGQVITIPDR
ncbi:MAG: polysaccharide deacetylase family protein [Flavobacteriaceae bacterium]|nr:polysaccharide deacetylase family protein [Flavobacteriaceae bacterium]MDB2314412.1 polysaccharide deacetylase family protein [Flavobacteriaceae bacterium]